MNARDDSPGQVGAPPRRWTAVALFQLGLVLAIAHVTVALEIGVSLSRHGPLVKSLVLLLYPVAVALLGFGAALDRIVLRSADPTPPLRASGALLVLFLLVTLRINFLSESSTDQAIAAAAHGAVLGAWFTCAGVALARLLRTARAGGARSTGWLWAAHQVGLVTGYLLQDALVPAVGANALHLALGLSLLLPVRLALPGLAALCLVAPGLDLDRRIDDLRNIDAIYSADYREVRGNRLLKTLRRQGDARPFRYRAWSRLGQFELVQVSDDSPVLGGWYNFQPQWGLHSDEGDELRAFRDQLYSLLPVDGRVAIVGVGGGRGLLSIPHPSKRYLAIERDPSVVRYFTRVAPDDNDRVFERLDTVAGDGRHVLERQTEPFDAIVFESARYQPAHSLLPASSPFYLYTRESIAANVERLADDGWISFGFTGVQPRIVPEYLPLQVIDALRSLGMRVASYQTDIADHVHIVGCRTDTCLARFQQAPVGRHAPWHPATAAAAAHRYRLTDATPFSAWATMKDPDRHSLLWVVGSVGLVCLSLGLGLVGRGRQARRWNPVPYLLSIGVAQSVFAVATCLLWRSFWQDDILTVVRVLIYLTAFGAAGSALSSRLPLHRLPRWGRVALIVTLLSAHFLGTAAIPFHQPSSVLRELAAIALLAPGGLAMGVFFPIGVAASSARKVGLVLLADALGALAGYTLMYLVALPFGIHAFAAVAVLSYGAAAALWTPRAEAGRATHATPPRRAGRRGEPPWGTMQQKPPCSEPAA